MLLPHRALLQALSAWLLLGVAASFWPAGQDGWIAGGALLATLALADALNLRRSPRLTAHRALPDRLARGVEREISLTLCHSGAAAARLRAWDTLPAGLACRDFPWSGAVPAKGFLTLSVRLHPVARGPATCGLVQLEERSRLGLWCRRYAAGAPAETKVYPNYQPVIRLALLSLLNQRTPQGLRQPQRAGPSREFRQLRDYQDGDALGQIDWKATARRLSLVSREYQEQRNQTVILLIDCGRRLRAVDGDLTQFDHSLNALLLLSFIALRQGDAVGALSFGSDPPRWLPPVKGPHAMPTILDHLYNYQPSSAPGDFSEAAESLLARWPRRALVILATNLRSEDESQFAAPLAEMRRRHLVVVASLREAEVAALETAPVTDLASALRFAAVQQYLEERRQLLEKLHRSGILTVDAPAAALPLALGNLYLGIKQRGTL